MTLLLVRHASAGDRQLWEGDDRLRPLDPRGVTQAHDLVALLDRFEIEAIYTSPFLRCVQTVEPLAAARRLAVAAREELGEREQYESGSGFVRPLAARPVVVCGHGGLETILLDDPPKWRKCETLVLDEQLRLVEALR
jgi:8-oxo-dGTP diphosphatase